MLSMLEEDAILYEFVLNGCSYQFSVSDNLIHFDLFYKNICFLGGKILDIKRNVVVK